ncbi:MAG: DNA-binding protein [Chitinophagaceae bacterium]|nr:MAG: DNA-binding protein [Chitinophagaceae bacterium]
MTKLQWARKMKADFDERYGTEWESEADMIAAIDHFWFEKRFEDIYKIGYAMFMAEEDRSALVLRFSSYSLGMCLQLQRLVDDPYLKEERKLGVRRALQFLTDLRTYFTELYRSYRIAYPVGTEAPVVPLPADFGVGDTMHVTPGQDWLDVVDVAAILGVEKETVYGKVQKRELPHHRPGKRILFRREDIEEHVAKARLKSTGEMAAEAKRKRK